MSVRGGHAACTLALGALLVAPCAHATSASLSGPGPRALSLAGAGASLDLGYESTFVNPAALSALSEPALHAGYSVTQLRLRLKRGDEPEQAVSTEALAATSLGFTLPLWQGEAEQRLVLGFASVSPGGFVARADLPLPEQPQFPFLVGRRQAVDLDLSLGLRPLSFVSIGVGVRALSTLSGTVNVERGKTRTTTRVDDTLEPVFAPLAGLRLLLGQVSTLGLVYRAPLRADFDVRLGAVDLGSTQLPPLNLVGVAHYDPASFIVEYAARLGDFDGVLGVTYERYRDTPTLLPRTVDCPPERPDCLALDAKSPNLHDTFDLNAAVRYRLRYSRSTQGELRAGYAYLPSPVPEQKADANLLDNSRHRLAFGYGLTLREPLPELGLELGLQYDRLLRREHHKQAGVARDNPGWPNLATTGSSVTAAFELSVRLR